jgi:hypothetical protein
MIIAFSSLQPRQRVGLILTFLTVLSSTSKADHEHHAEHEAVHATTLWKKEPRYTKQQKFQHGVRQHTFSDVTEPFLAEELLSSQARGQDIGLEHDWERIVNLTTALHDQKSEYTGKIGVGTGPGGKALFEANVVFDTGSTNLWVASVLCKSGPCLNGRQSQFYDPSKSKTEEEYQGRKDDIDIMFGTGELKGALHVDTYRVGPMEVKAQPFAMIREMTGEVFASFPFEGILGLAFKSLSFGGITPFFERVIEQKVLKNNEFAFYLNTDSSKPSALLWGGVDKDLYEGPIVMFQVTQPHYWALELVEFRIGDKIFGGTRHPDSNLKKVIVDSGTTYFTTPRAIFSSVLSRMKEAPCKDVDDYQPMVYVLRGVKGETFELVVTQETYMVGVANDEETCRPAFMPLDVSSKYGPALILGEVFMRHFFTVFSRGGGGDDEARIGIAQAKIGADVKMGSKKSQQGHVDETQQFLTGHLMDESGGSAQALTEQSVRKDPTERRHHQQITSLKTPVGAHRYRGHLFALRINDDDDVPPPSGGEPARDVVDGAPGSPTGSSDLRGRSARQ